MNEVIGIIIAAVKFIVYYSNRMTYNEEEEKKECAKCKKAAIKIIIALTISFLAILATPGSEGYRRILINKYQQETQVNYDEAEFKVNQILGRV